jgi:type III restriction enzyme
MSQTIEHLIICSPYEKPSSHWHYNREKRVFDRQQERRPAGYLASSGGTSFDDPGIFHELPLVNRIRQRVDAWRDKRYPGVTGTTKELLEYWHNPQERDNRFFFCQIEAIETLIWLVEAPASEKQGIEIPSDGGPFQRICSKMATGAGKTIVMGMLIAWHTLNKVAYPEDPRFSKNFLVIARGLTVKKRLQVLDPFVENNIYKDFKIVPSKKFDSLRQARITIHNWHTLMPHEENPKSVVKKGKESNEAFTRRILGNSNHTRKNIVVINDEAHHAWRPKPDDKPNISSEQLEEATRWMEGLDRIHARRTVMVCHDFSATPFIPTGKGISEETLYEWIVSDFSLNDAIESGLVKTPRVAVRDDGRFSKDYHSRFYHIYLLLGLIHRNNSIQAAFISQYIQISIRPRLNVGYSAAKASCEYYFRCFA